MPLFSLGSLSMRTSTLMASWSAAINRVCAVCYGSSREATPRWRTTSRKTPSSALTKTFAAFAVKRSSPPGFTESPTIAFAKTRANARNCALYRGRWFPRLCFAPTATAGATLAIFAAADPRRHERFRKRLDLRFVGRRTLFDRRNVQGHDNTHAVGRCFRARQRNVSDGRRHLCRHGPESDSILA